MRHVARQDALAVQVGNQGRIAQRGQASCAFHRMSANTARIGEQHDGRTRTSLLRLDQDAFQPDIAVSILEGRRGHPCLRAVSLQDIGIGIAPEARSVGHDEAAVDRRHQLAVEARLEIQVVALDHASDPPRAASR